MILYKYRSLAQLDYVADILVNERLFCPQYFRLNDPFEGLFRLVTHFPANEFNSVPLRVTGVADVEHLIDMENYVDVRVCSLSATIEDVRLWAHYGGGHRGVAIEVDCACFGDRVDRVDYQTAIPTYDDPRYAGPSVRQALSVKTKQWEYEQEYRILTFGADEYLSVKGQIRRVLMGPRCLPADIAVIQRLLPEKATITRTSLDHEHVRVIERDD
jgi:hypothetical protein